MPDIIHLLPDSVANQIAAGEVIQRPASAVKELLENAVDAGSTKIELYTRDSGKTLIQVIDNGSGLSTTDARLCFARHATSKIRTADDLFAIRTMGFRGEALASIAAIAQVELKSRREEDEIGTQLVIEGNEVKRQQPASTSKGTSITVKNLFYNVPARRNFLKSDSIEARHIIDEFERVALAHPDIAMSLNHNGLEVFKLPVSNLRQRIVNICGTHYNERLVPVNEETSLLKIQGFIGKPEFAKKTRGEQFFFVNRRYIRDGYLHHAVSNAFEELLPRENFASYWLFIDIDPARIDINIHPTKTEIKFEDDRSVYPIVRASVKRALGMYNVSPAIDFEQEKSFDVPHSMRNQTPVRPGLTVNPNFNPFQNEKDKLASSGWDRLYSGLPSFTISPDQPQASQLSNTSNDSDGSNANPFPEEHLLFQLSNQFIVQAVGEGLLILDQQQAHERILYERYLRQLNQVENLSQQELFPQTLSFSVSDYQLVKELQSEIRLLGFDIHEFGLNTFVLHGSPAGVEKGKEHEILESLLEQYKNNQGLMSLGVRENLARSMAGSMSIKRGRLLSRREMEMLIADLNKCEKPGTGPDGKACMILLKTEELKLRFK